MGIFETITELVGKGKKRQPSQPRKAVDKSVLLNKIRESELFRNLPPKSLEEMFAHMETLDIQEGDTVIREGDEGDYYYLLVSGSARVLRQRPDDPKPQVVAELGEPLGFGEEALISNAKRNATIIMTSDGTLMRLSKDAFNDYVKEPLITWVSPKEAQDQIGQGAKWIDVREKTGSKDAAAHLPGSITIPMAELRSRTAELDKGTVYICYCENGRLSSTAAFLLRQRGYNVGVLRGGLQSLKRAGIA